MRIESKVFPRALTEAYTLPGTALSYGNGRTPGEIGRLWRELLVDAVDLAAADPDGPDFKAFDSYLVIHAGRGHETGELNDIRSVFLRPEDLDEHGGPIEVEGAVIREAWILPEAVDFSGRGGLNGILARFFGHQLGLPGLSNFARGRPAVGGWSLMDVGANLSGFVRVGGELQFVVGMVPPHPMAWSKARLGWVEPLEVRRDTVVQILAADRPADGVEAVPAVRVPLSPTEYLLLENRQQRGRTEHDLPPGVEAPFSGEFAWIEAGEAELSRRITAAESDSLAGRGAGVWLRADEYDAFVPGSGVLIWHVDDAVIAAAPAEGFNNERERPGLMLVEADGARDIGNPWFDRQDVVEGTRSDPFYSGTGPGGVVGVNRFGPDTIPATVTHTGLATGLEVEVLSELDDRMSVRLRFTRSAAGWPRPLGEVRRLQASDVNGDGGPELLAEGESGLRVLPAAPAEGAAVDDALLAAGDGLLFTSSAAGLAAARPAGAAPSWERPLDGRPAHALYTADLGGRGAILAAGGPGGLSVLDALTGEPRFTRGAPVRGMAAADTDGDGADELLILGEGEVLRYDGAEATALAGDLAGDLAGSWMPPSAADLDGDGLADVVLAGRGGQLRSLGQGSGDLRVSVGAPVLAPASFADLDGDGLLEVLAPTAGAVHAYSAAGLRRPGFPAAPPAHQESGPLRGEVAAADLNASGAAEVFVSAGNGVYGFDGDGLLLSGFPVASPQRPTTAPVLADFDGDGGLDLAAGDGEGVNLWRPVSWEPAFAAGTPTGWSQAGGSASGRRAHPSVPRQTPPAPEAIDLLPASQAWCYPNPAGGAEPARLRFFVGGPARVSLTVYDSMGEVVDRLEAAGVRAAEANEIAWSVSGYASGLYLCRLVARGEDGRRGEATVRLAVSH